MTAMKMLFLAMTTAITSQLLNYKITRHNADDASVTLAGSEFTDDSAEALPFYPTESL
jgi:hypothetical protein